MNSRIEEGPGNSKRIAGGKKGINRNRPREKGGGESLAIRKRKLYRVATGKKDIFEEPVQRIKAQLRVLGGGRPAIDGRARRKKATF